MSRSEHSYKDLFLGAFFGGTLGAMTALVFGTKDGKKVQKQVKDKYKELRLLAEDYLSNKEKIKNKVRTKIRAKAKKIKRAK